MRQAIQERIKQLDFQDAKVRVSNVDSQAAHEGSIVIQVIGEVSNKGAEPKKFIQTFVLAQQPSGYFVLNDIWRYVNEEADEVNEEPEVSADRPNADVTVADPAEPEAEEPVEAPKEKSPEVDADAVDTKLEKAAEPETVDGNGAAAPAAVDSAQAEPEVPKADPAAAAQELAEEDAKEPEKPKDPAPTPSAKPVAKPEAPAPAAPSKPLTWASRAAAAAGPKPVVPLPKTSTPPAQKENRTPAPAAPAAAAPQPKSPAAAPATTEAPSKDNSGWQTAGSDSKRQNRPQSVSAAPAEKEGTLGYVKFVTDKVQDADLRKALEAHGELAYFDINRQKNCAFVEYKTTEGYHAALNSNPHTVNGEQIVVEQRRPKQNAYGGPSYGPGRGGARNGGRGGFDGRQGQGNARGNFGQGRGRGGAPRGRGGAQATNA